MCRGSIDSRPPSPGSEKMYQQRFAKGLSAHLGRHGIPQLSQLHGDTSPVIHTPSVDVVKRFGEFHTGDDVVFSVGLGLRYLEEIDADIAPEGPGLHTLGRAKNRSIFQSPGFSKLRETVISAEEAEACDI